MRPVKAHERIVTLDILRGMALLGVLIVHGNWVFNQLWFFSSENSDALSQLSLDAVAFFGIETFFEGKAITIFSFLFGLGIALQMGRTEEKGIRVMPFFSRRLAILFVIGVFHAVLLFHGDILIVYAVLGFALLLFRERSDRTLLLWAGAIVMAVLLIFGGMRWWDAAMGIEPAGWEGYRALVENFTSSDVATVLAANVGLLVHRIASGSIWEFQGVFLAVFLIGMLVGRRRIFENIGAHREGFRRVRTWGLALGIPLSILTALWWQIIPPEWRDAAPSLAMAYWVVFNVSIVLAAGYVATVTLLLHDSEAWKRRLSIFAPVGRMALTNYIAQSVMGILIFYGPGLGLMGQIGPATALGITLAVFAVQILWSRWWLARFRFGPLEWLWRVATYGKLQPMRGPALEPARAPVVDR